MCVLLASPQLPQRITYLQHVPVLSLGVNLTAYSGKLRLLPSASLCPTGVGDITGPVADVNLMVRTVCWGRLGGQGPS